MPLPAEQIEAEALSLPLRERARLAEALIASLDDDAEIERAWEDEIARRVKEIDAGSVELIPAEEVFQYAASCCDASLLHWSTKFESRR